MTVERVGPGLLFLLIASPVSAATDTVLLVDFAVDFADERWPAAESAAESELIGMGFIVERVRNAARDEAGRRVALEDLAAAEDAIAAVSIRRNLGDQTAELWLVDRVTRKTSQRRLPASLVNGRRAANLAAMCLADLIHASLIELRLEHAKLDAENAPAIVQRLVEEQLPAAARERRPLGVTAGVGIATLWFPGRLETSFGPSVQVQTELWRQWQASAEGYFAGTSTSLRKAEASAAVSLDAGRLGLAYRVEAGQALGFRASLSGTALFLRSVGVGGEGLRGGGRFAVVPAVSLGAAFAVRFGRLGVVASVGGDWVLTRLPLELGRVKVASVHGCLLGGALLASWSL